MKALRASLLLLAFGTSACTSLSRVESNHAPEPAVATPPAPADSPVEAAAPVAVEPIAPEAPMVSVAEEPLAETSTKLTDAELAVWRDPAFRKRFVEGLLADMDVEPRRDVREGEQIAKILEYMQSEQYPRAIELALKCNSPQATAEFDLLLGKLYFLQDRPIEAIAATRTATKKHKSFRRAHRQLGTYLCLRGDYKAALPSLTKCIQLGGGEGATYGLLGYSYDSVGNSLSAETAYRMAILLDPETVDWKRGLAISLFKQNRYADAVALFDTLITEQPDNAELWMAQGDAYVGMGQRLSAAQNYEMVDQLGGSTPRTLNTLGDIYVIEELFDLAADRYGRAFALEPKEGLERALRSAKELAYRGAFDETLAMVEQIEILAADQLQTTDQTDLLRLRARIAAASDATDTEAGILREIVALDPLDGQALLMLGDLHRREGDHPVAISYYEQASSIEAFEADAYVKHAQLLADQGKYSEALPLLSRAQGIEHRQHVENFLDRVKRAAENR